MLVAIVHWGFRMSQLLRSLQSGKFKKIVRIGSADWVKKMEQLSQILGQRCKTWGRTQFRAAPVEKLCIMLCLADFSLLFFYLITSPLHTSSCCPIYRRAPAQDYRCCAGAYPMPSYHSWRVHSEDWETPGIEPGTSQSPDERSTN